mgnify:CR=1 FL=1
MKIPDNTQLYEGELYTFWFDTNGFLCAFAKNVDRSLDKQKKHFEFVRQITDNKKVCFMADTTNSKIINTETREHSEREMPNLFKAIAILSDTALGKVNTVVFQNLNIQSVPLKTFSGEMEAKEWLKLYL